MPVHYLDYITMTIKIIRSRCLHLGMSHNTCVDEEVYNISRRVNQVFFDFRPRIEPDSKYIVVEDSLFMVIVFFIYHVLS